MTSGVDETTRPATIAPAIAAEGQPAALTTLGLMTVLIGVFLPMTDFFIVNVALPTIDRDLHAPAGMLQLVVAGYAIAYALLLVVGGRIGDAVGRKRLFLIGMAAFTVTSLACGVAPGIDALVAGRALQGAASAMMLPQVLSTIQATRSGPARARARGSYGATGGIAVVAGQLLGGLLVSANIAGMTWRPIFLVNVPVGIIVLLVASRIVPATRSAHPLGADLPGTVLFAATLTALLVPLTEGHALGWPWWTWLLIASAVALGGLTCLVEKRAEARGEVPLLPPSLLKLRSMSRGLVMVLIFSMGFGSFMFVFALTVQDGLRADALRGGLSILPMAVAFLAGSLVAARMITRFGRAAMSAGAVVQLAGLAWLVTVLVTSWPHVGLWAMAGPLALVGAGQSMLFTGLFRAVLADVPAHLGGIGGGALITLQQAGLALGVATLGTLYLVLQPYSYPRAFAGVEYIQMGIVAILAIGAAALPRFTKTSGDAPLVRRQR